MKINFLLDIFCQSIIHGFKRQKFNFFKKGDFINNAKLLPNVTPRRENQHCQKYRDYVERYNISLGVLKRETSLIH